MILADYTEREYERRRYNHRADNCLAGGEISPDTLLQ